MPNYKSIARVIATSCPVILLGTCIITCTLNWISATCVLRRLIGGLSTLFISVSIGALIAFLFGYLTLCTRNTVYSITYMVYMLIAIVVECIICIYMHNNALIVHEIKSYYTIDVFKQMKLDLESNYSCCGFDDSPESRAFCVNPSVIDCTKAVSDDISKLFSMLKKLFITTIIICFLSFIVHLVFMPSSRKQKKGYTEMEQLEY